VGELPAVISPTIALEELARVLNVWSERSFVVTSRTALMQWVRETAAFTPRNPRPAAGIGLLTMLGLATANAAGELQPDSVLPSLISDPAEAHDRLPPAAAGDVFQRLLAQPLFNADLQQVLSCVRISHGQLVVPWRQVPPDLRPNIAWLWLQQLGLAQHDGPQVLVDRSLRPFVADFIWLRHGLSQTELDECHALQRERAAAAENYAVEFERQRLVAAGCPHYAIGVRRVSVEKVDAGYDIRSFETTGAPRFIEVKSSAGPRAFFFLSRNEYRFARRRGTSCWLAWVGWAARLPAGPCEVAWFRDPVKTVMAMKSPWRVTYSQLRVRRVSDDTTFQAVP
jgi:hypothetical protein